MKAHILDLRRMAKKTAYDRLRRAALRKAWSIRKDKEEAARPLREYL